MNDGWGNPVPQRQQFSPGSLLEDTPMTPDQKRDVDRTRMPERDKLLFRFLKGLSDARQGLAKMMHPEVKLKDED